MQHLIPPQKQPYTGTDEPLRYMACLKVYANGFVTISKKLAAALGLSQGLEGVCFITSDDVCFITSDGADPHSVPAWVQPDGSYTLQKSPTAAYPQLADILTNYFGLDSNHRYLSVVTSTQTYFGDGVIGMEVRKLNKK